MPNFAGTPSWDLLLGVVLFIIIVYGFIIGNAKTFKTLLALYPAFFMADILGKFLPTLFPNLAIAFINNEEVKTFTLSQQTDSLQVIIITKIVVFLLFWLLITVKTPFQVEIETNNKKIGNVFLHFILSLSFGILLMNVVLHLLSGLSVFGDDPVFHILAGVMAESFLVTLFIQFSGVWFAVPALVLVLSGFLHSPAEEEEEEEEILEEEA